MRPGISAVALAICMLGGVPAWSACPPGQSRNCLNLDVVPQISGEIVAGERPVTPPVNTAPQPDGQPAYSGPTLGLSKTVRQTPTFGYRWSID